MQAQPRAQGVKSLAAPVVTVVAVLCAGFLLWRGSSLVLAGAMTVGMLIVFLTYLAYLGKFFKPVQQLSGQADTAVATAAAAQRIPAILETEDVIEHSDAIDPPPFRGEIAFEHVAFAYDVDRAVLRDVSFNVEPGELVGILGPTGSGKSTIVSLVPRFYDPDSGTITIDGIDIRGFTLSGLRGQIGFVLQDTVLLRGTVVDNIAFGRPDATDDEIVQAAKLANADEFISRMPHGYDSVVGDRGLTLSGGQRQRIGIARALIRDNPILILDEPTAALDAESERLVIEALDRLMKGRTVLHIAHRLASIRDADTIILIKDGVVAEQGSHQELMALNGVYAQLHSIQYGDI